MIKDRLLAIILISCVWISVLFIGIILAILFHGDYFLIRTILIIPFTSSGFSISERVWRKYQQP